MKNLKNLKGVCHMFTKLYLNLNEKFKKKNYIILGKLNI